MRQPLQALDQQVFDVAVIGGGINGASAARCLAELGYRTILIEKEDFASGATSRSSRLIHNGLWHLATDAGFWGAMKKPLELWSHVKGAREYLVNQTESRRVHGGRLHNFIYLIPEGGTNPYKSWQMEMGMRAVNVASLGRGSVSHWRIEDPAQYSLYRYFAAGRTPGKVLAMDDIMADSPERICVDLALEAESLGATLVNHAPVRAISRAGSAWTIGVEDALGGGSAEVTAAVVLNTAGAWANGVDALVSKSGTRRVAPTKGAHLMIKMPEFQPGVALLTMTRDGHEPFFASPFRGMYMTGNTHTRYMDDLDHIEVTPIEFEHLLAEAQAAFPGANLDESNVVYGYSGVRPLTASAVSFAFNGEVHDLGEEEDIPNMLTLTGAPVGTYPAVGRKLAAAAQAKLAESGRSAGPRPTPRVAPADPGVDQVPADRICDHDTRTLRDAARGLAEEHAATLSDVLRRRTSSAWNECMCLHAARRVAETIAPLAGWDAAKVEVEVGRYTDEVVGTFHPRAASVAAVG